jgi:hypothetical protein
LKKNDDIAALKAEIESLKNQMNNDTLKRGLQRSSIATGRLDAADTAGLASIESYKRGYNAEISAADKKIEALKTDFDSAVRDLEYEKAYDAQSKLEDLIKERNSLEAEMIKYNKTVDEKNNDYIMKYNKYLEDMRASESKNGVGPELNKSYNDRYALALDFYSGLDKRTAKDLISNNAYLKTYLGSVYYNKLLGTFK